MVQFINDKIQDQLNVKHYNFYVDLFLSAFFNIYCIV